jgi:hypothetical protein
MVCQDMVKARLHVSIILLLVYLLAVLYEVSTRQNYAYTMAAAARRCDELAHSTGEFRAPTLLLCLEEYK